MNLAEMVIKETKNKHLLIVEMVQEIGRRVMIYLKKYPI